MRTTVVLFVAALVAVGVWAAEGRWKSTPTPEEAYQAGLRIGLERGTRFAQLAASANGHGGLQPDFNNAELHFVWNDEPEDPGVTSRLSVP